MVSAWKRAKVGMRRLQNRRGQGMLEYLLILGVVVAAIVAFSGLFQGSVTNTVNAGSATVDKSTAALSAVDMTTAKNW